MSGSSRDVRAHYDRLAQNGPYGTLAPGNRGGNKGRYVAAVFDAALEPELRRRHPVGQLLDLGCGTGIFAARAAPLVERYLGVDLSAGVLGVARELCADRANVSFAQVGDGALPLRDASIDVCVARETLCYVPDQALPGVAADLARVVKPSGWVLVLDQISDNPRWQDHPGAPHLRKRSAAGIERAFTAAGFRLDHAHAVRAPRWPLIYPVWAGLVPVAWLAPLARAEVAWHRRMTPLATRRWINALFAFQRSGS